MQQSYCLMNYHVQCGARLINIKIYFLKPGMDLYYTGNVGCPTKEELCCYSLMLDELQGGPYITTNLYYISLSEHEICVKADAVQICGNI